MKVSSERIPLMLWSKTAHWQICIQCSLYYKATLSAKIMWLYTSGGLWLQGCYNAGNVIRPFIRWVLREILETSIIFLTSFIIPAVWGIVPWAKASTMVHDHSGESVLCSMGLVVWKVTVLTHIQRLAKCCVDTYLPSMVSATPPIKVKAIFHL